MQPFSAVDVTSRQSQDRRFVDEPGTPSHSTGRGTTSSSDTDMEGKQQDADNQMDMDEEEITLARLDRRGRKRKAPWRNYLDMS